MKNTTKWTIIIISIITIQFIWKVFYKTISWQLNIILSVIWIAFVILLFRWMDKRTNYFKKNPEDRIKSIEESGGFKVLGNTFYFIGLACIGISMVFLLFPGKLGDDKWAAFTVMVIFGILILICGYFTKKSLSQSQ